MRHYTSLFCLSLLIMPSTACLVGNGSGGGEAIVRSVQVDAGNACQYGGVRIETGRDANGDGDLDTDEVDNTSYACNARVDGFTALVKTSPASSQDCATGGVTILSGLDRDEDGELSDREITHTEHVCDGERGLPGADGLDGRDGADGIDGVDGGDGFTTLVTVTQFEPDSAGACYFGGTRIDSGLDRDRDGVLAQSEIEHTRHVCSVHTNDRMTLVEHAMEPGGNNCPHGGIVMTVGFDEDGSKTLEQVEIEYTGYICNELVVIDGKNSLLHTSPATAGQCSEGGYVLTSGLDDDGDGVLDSNEVESTSIVCNGIDGASGLVLTRPYSGGSCGPDGTGREIRAGRDLDHNGILDANEVEHTSVVCDGQDGFLGYDGRDSLIKTSGDRGACPYGGFVFEAGLDLDEDGNLDANEVTSTEYVCDGYDGLNSLVELSHHGNVCVYDGYRVDVGLDLDSDGFLSSGEIESTAYVCDGIDGFDSLVEVTVDPIECAFTGIRFDTGLDMNVNGVLDFSEIQHSSVICD
jgi:hypothetical protein